MVPARKKVVPTCDDKKAIPTCHEKKAILPAMKKKAIPTCHEKKRILSAMKKEATLDKPTPFQGKEFARDALSCSQIRQLAFACSFISFQYNHQ